MSRRPNSPTVSATARLLSASWATSPALATTTLPNSACNCSALAATRSKTPTRAPSSTNRATTARPMPEPPPVTRATCPSSQPMARSSSRTPPVHCRLCPFRGPGRHIDLRYSASSWQVMQILAGRSIWAEWEAVVSEENTKLVGPDFSEGIPNVDLPDDCMILGQVGGEAVLLARSGGALFAIGAECSHYHGPLAGGGARRRRH